MDSIIRKKKIRLKISFFIVALSLLFNFSGCSAPSYQSQSEFFDCGPDGLLKDCDYTFHPFSSHVADSTETSCDIFLIIRFTERCPLKSLPLDLEYPSPSFDSICKEKINVELFSHDNRNLGKGNYGVFEIKMPLLHNISPTDDFFLSLHTSEPQTQGIVGIGIETKPV